MSVQLSIVRSQVRSYLDEATAADWNDTELDRMINQRYQRVISMVMTTYEDYYITTQTFNTVANQEEYTGDEGLPDDVFKIRRIEVNYDVTNTNSAPTRIFPLTNMDEVQRDLGLINGGNGLGSNVNGYYYSQGFAENFRLGIVPIPTKDGTDAGKIWYVQQQLDLIEDTDKINIPYPERYWHMIAEGATGDALRFGVQQSDEADKYDAKFDRGLILMQEELEDKNAEDYKSVIDVKGDLLDFSAI